VRSIALRRAQDNPWPSVLPMKACAPCALVFFHLLLRSSELGSGLNEKSPFADDEEAFILVGVAGFEPATSCSQSRRDDRATLHPVRKNNASEKAGGKISNSFGLNNGTSFKVLCSDDRLFCRQFILSTRLHSSVSFRGF
jgi:hypothetical protein